MTQMPACGFDCGSPIVQSCRSCPGNTSTTGNTTVSFALSDRTPLVRYLEVADPVRVVPVTPPLRILVVIASPSDLQQLDGEKEWSNVTAALSELQQRGRVEVVRLAKPTLGALQRQLRRDTYHIFHFIGHGGFDPNTQGGMLAMEDDHGRARLVGGEDLGTLLHNHRSLRLAVLNSCEGARGDRSDPFSGTAQSLVQQGIPAVVAMQFEITDDAAITFGHVLYEAIADGYPLDAATTEARIAVYADGNLTEWGTPVLYLRAPDGHIFDIQPPPLTNRPGRKPQHRPGGKPQNRPGKKPRSAPGGKPQHKPSKKPRSAPGGKPQHKPSKKPRARPAGSRSTSPARSRGARPAGSRRTSPARSRGARPAGSRRTSPARSRERARQKSRQFSGAEPACGAGRVARLERGRPGGFAVGSARGGFGGCGGLAGASGREPGR